MLKLKYGDVKSSLALNLREERKRVHLVQEDLAIKGGVRIATQRNYEAGVSAPPLSYLCLIAQHGIDVQFVVTGSRSKNLPLWKQQEVCCDDCSGRLEAVREKLSLSKRKVALLCGVHYNTQKRYETGETSPPADYLVRFASIGADIQHIVINMPSANLEEATKSALQILRSCEEKSQNAQDQPDTKKPPEK